MDISIIIVNYKSKGLTLNCIKSIKEADFGNLKYEIIVVDNNSEDEIEKFLSWQYPDVKFIQSGANPGVGYGNNLGAKLAQGDYLTIANPDTIVFRDTFIKLHNYLSNNPDVGLVGPQQFNPDKTIQDSCYRWYGLFTPFYRRTFIGKYNFAKKDLARFLMSDFNKQATKPVDWLLGSFLFCRAKTLKEIDLFDTSFFLYFEDTDLCRRFWEHGYKVIYYPEAKIIHNHNRDSAKVPWYYFFTNKASRAHVISWLKYIRKWGVKLY